MQSGQWTGTDRVYGRDFDYKYSVEFVEKLSIINAQATYVLQSVYHGLVCLFCRGSCAAM